MCFVHKHMQNADFGQILCWHASTKRCVTSRPMVRFSQTWYQKMRKTWKKKVMKRRVAICGGCEAVTDFVQGGSNWPPPPVKIGLNHEPMVLSKPCWALSASALWQLNKSWFLRLPCAHCLNHALKAVNIFVYYIIRLREHCLSLEWISVIMSRQTRD